MIFILLPCYNEEAGLSKLLDRIDFAMKQNIFNYRVVVVDDGSTDRTSAIVASLKEKYPIDLLTHSPNRGLGEALKTGILHIMSKAELEDIAVIMDADNTHPPDLIGEMNRRIQNGADLVIASRYRKGSRVIGVPLYRRILSRGVGLLFQTFLPIPGVSDFSSGYRAYRVSLLKRVLQKYNGGFLSEKGFSCMIDVLLKLKPFEPVIKEVPIILEYNKKEGATKIKISKSVKSTLKLLCSNLNK